MKIGVIIRARNAAKDLTECLPAVRRQRTPEGVTFEIIVVDNESTDTTRAIAMQHGTRIVDISAREFSWGRALNRGIAAAEASGADVAVLLSADATPVDDEWLREMTAPFADAQIAAVYGRQMPRANAPVDEVVRLRRAFDDAPRKLTREQIASDLASKRWVCSNACGAVRVSVWGRNRFDELVPASEEIPWMQAVHAEGMRAVYVPSARVYHSHREGILRMSMREWEIHEKTVGKCPRWSRVLSGLRLSAAIAKRRIKSCASALNAPRAVIEGLIRLPFECVTVVLVAAATLWPKAYAATRRAAWRQS
jgi:glycosyltransferase involved in cell wall biosynthesis